MSNLQIVATEYLRQAHAEGGHEEHVTGRQLLALDLLPRDDAELVFQCYTAMRQCAVCSARLSAHRSRGSGLGFAAPMPRAS